MLGAGFEAGVGSESEQARGLIPRVFDDVFARLQAMKDQAEVGPFPNRSCIAAASQLHFENGRSLCRPSCGEVFLVLNARHQAVLGHPRPCSRHTKWPLPHGEWVILRAYPSG